MTSDNPAENAEPPWHPEPDASKATPHTAHEDAADPATTAHATASEDTVTEHWFIPKQEQQEIVDALTEVPDIMSDLIAASFTTLRAANWNPKVSTGDNVQPLPFNVNAVDAQDCLLICLEAWALWLADTRNIQITENTVVGYAEWLTRNILLLAATQGSEAAHHGITTEITRARKNTGRLQPTPKPDPQRIALAGQKEVTSKDIATIATQIGIEGLTQKRVNNLKLLGYLTPLRTEGKVHIYRLADALQAHELTRPYHRQDAS